MIPTAFSVIMPAALAFLVLTGIGWPLARLTMPVGLALGVAPALGWAVFSVVALAIFAVLPFNAVGVLLVCLLSLAAGLGLLMIPPPPQSSGLSLPYWAVPVAGMLAVLPAIAIFPKSDHTGLLLGPPMYDHVKIAIVDAIARQGMPPHNPFFGAAGANAPLAYYYLWHFSAAMLAVCLSITGWSADIAMTWFTATASALLMMALAVHIAARRRAAWLVAALCLPAALRPVLNLFGPHAGRLMIINADIGAWVNQASWVPQHLAAACCVVLSAILIAEIARGRRLAPALLLPFSVAAGFESSVWVGGIAFAAACALAAPCLLWRIPKPDRWPFIARLAVAVGLTVVLVTPFALGLAAGMAAKQAGLPIALQPYRALDYGPASDGWRLALDLVAYWIIVLPFNLPAVVPLGAVGAVLALRAGGTRDPLLIVLACFAVACFAVTWLLKSTIDNNDLGWRAVLPGLFILTAFAAAFWSRFVGMRAKPPALVAGMAAFALLAAIGLPQQAWKVRQYVYGQQPADGFGFAQSAALWRAVQSVAGSADRVANNPQSFTSTTYWPDNISWALFSNRPSCYSGHATAIAYGNLPPSGLALADALFRRVFDGHAQPGDVSAMALHYGCRVVAVTVMDGAWSNDPFAHAPEYSLVQTQPHHWRIYRSITGAP